jgi:hypothetical protein
MTKFTPVILLPNPILHLLNLRKFTVNLQPYEGKYSDHLQQQIGLKINFRRKIMTNIPPSNRPEQGHNQTGFAGKNLNQVIGDTTQSTNLSFLSGNVFLFILVGIVSLGTLAWALGVRVKQGQNGIEIQYQNQQQQLNPTSSPKKNP